MKKTIQSYIVFFILFVVGSVGVDLVQGRSLDLENIFANVVIGAFAAMVFGAFISKGKTDN